MTVERARSAKSGAGPWRGYESASAQRLATRVRWPPLILIGVGLAIAYATGLDHLFSLDALRGYRAGLSRLVSDNRVMAMCLYVVVYSSPSPFHVPARAF